MATVKLDLQNRDDDDLVNFARTHITKLAENAADFPDPDPNVADFLALVDNFEAGILKAKADAATAAASNSAKDDLRVLLEDGLRLRKSFVQKKSGGLETKILAVGLEVKATATPIGDLLAPENLRATFGDSAGEIDLAWDRVRGASSYLIEMRESGTTAWLSANPSTKSSATVDGLTPGKTYEFRVRAVGAAGPGAWSSVASKMAP